MEHYLQVRLLQWAAQVVRMDYKRLPRKFLFGWVNNSRPVGRPFLTFAHRIKRVVKAAFKKVHPSVKPLMLILTQQKGRNENVQLDWVKLTKHKRAWKWLVNAGDAKKKGCQSIPTLWTFYRKAVQNLS